MLRYFILFLIISLIFVGCKQHNQKLETKEKVNSNVQYKDFIIDGNIIWGLTQDGKIKLFNSENGSTIDKSIKNDSEIIILTKDNNNDIIIGDKNKNIKKFNKENNTWTTITKYSNILLGITFNTKNKCYIITDKGIIDNSSYKTYKPPKLHNFTDHPGATGHIQYPVYMTDKNDNIWIGFGYGEWGSDLFIFNTMKNHFIEKEYYKFHITSNPINSIFEGYGDIYISAGLMHFETSGIIAEFNILKEKIIYDSESQRRLEYMNNKVKMIGEYIGPATFNKTDSCIYFYSQHGIFKGNPKNDLSKIEYWTKVVKPNLHWSKGQPDAVGSPMNVLKLKFISPNKLVFVSRNDGIGIYDGKSVKMLR